MKFSRNKITAVILILSVSVMSSFFLGCGNKNAGEDDNSDIATSAAETGAEDGGGQEEATDFAESTDSIGARPEYDLPEKDFDGYNFRIISRSQTANAHWWNCDIGAAEETGDPINDAVYQRNKKVEEKYNITITNIPDDDVGAKAAKSAKAGSDDYDLIVIGLNGGQENLTIQGLLMDLKNMPFVDLEKPWWDQKAVEQLSINNKLFSTSCDLTVRDKDAVIILMFSQKLVKEYELENPYGLVLSGKWTFDKMFDMMKSVSRDLNGDGTINDEDQIGLLTEYSHSRCLFNAAGEYAAKLNAGKIPEITLYNARAAEICDKIGEMQGNKNYAINAEDMSGKYADIFDGFQLSMFSEDRALFYHAGMNRVTLLRSMETDFGILPPPKYNEQQDKYYANVSAWCSSGVSVPITVPDKEKTGLILETLAYESRYILLPAYYDINLKTKFARDEQSGQMIDIILANRLYDLGEIYSWGSTVSFFSDISQGKGSSLATYWEKNSPKIESDMNKTMERIDNLG